MFFNASFLVLLDIQQQFLVPSCHGISNFGAFFFTGSPCGLWGVGFCFFPPFYHI